MSDTSIRQTETTSALEKADSEFPWMIKGTVSTKTDGTCNVLIVVPFAYASRDGNTEKLGAYLATALDSHAVINNHKYRGRNIRKREQWDREANVLDLNIRGEAWSCKKDYVDRITTLIKEINKVSQNEALVFFIGGKGDTKTQPQDTIPDIVIGEGFDDFCYDGRKASASEQFFSQLIRKIQKQGLGVLGFSTGRGPYDVPLILFQRREDFKIRLEAVHFKLKLRGYRDSDENLKNTADKLARAIQGMSSFKSWRKEEMGPGELADTKALKGVQLQTEEHVAPIEPEIIDVGPSIVPPHEPTSHEESLQSPRPPEHLDLHEALGHDTEVRLMPADMFRAQIDVLRQSTTIKNDNGEEVPFEGETKEEFIRLYERGYPVAKKLMETVYETGSFLSEVRKRLKPKKLFLRWMEMTGNHERNSYRYLKAYERFGDHLLEFGHLGIRKLLAAAQLPNCVEYLEEHKEDAISQTVAQFEKTIRRLRAAKNKGGRGRKPKYEEIAGCKLRRSKDGTKITVEGLSKESQEELFEAIKALLSKDKD